MENTTNSVTYGGQGHLITFDFTRGINKNSIPDLSSTKEKKDWFDAMVRLFQLLEDAGNEKVDITAIERKDSYFVLTRERSLKGCKISEVKQAVLQKVASL